LLLDEFSPKKKITGESILTYHVITNRSAAKYKSYDDACHATKEESLLNILLKELRTAAMINSE
jgi:hypothetical protein